MLTKTNLNAPIVDAINQHNAETDEPMTLSLGEHLPDPGPSAVALPLKIGWQGVEFDATLVDEEDCPKTLSNFVGVEPQEIDSVDEVEELATCTVPFGLRIDDGAVIGLVTCIYAESLTPQMLRHTLTELMQAMGRVAAYLLVKAVNPA